MSYFDADVSNCTLFGKKMCSQISVLTLSQDQNNPAQKLK